MKEYNLFTTTYHLAIIRHNIWVTWAYYSSQYFGPLLLSFAVFELRSFWSNPREDILFPTDAEYIMSHSLKILVKYEKDYFYVFLVVCKIDGVEMQAD